MALTVFKQLPQRYVFHFQLFNFLIARRWLFEPELPFHLLLGFCSEQPIWILLLATTICVGNARIWYFRRASACAALARRIAAVRTEN